MATKVIVVALVVVIGAVLVALYLAGLMGNAPVG
jgi:hypothetical protein